MATTTAAIFPREGVRVTEEEYRLIGLADTGGTWELDGGRLREKPGMSVEHGRVMFELGHDLGLQLDRREYGIRVNHARLRRSAEQYYVPDMAVIPAALERALFRQPGSLDAYAEPLPLVVEVWSPSTGTYDVDTKIPAYQARGDEEIWRLHPYARTLQVWRRRADGGYDEAVYAGGAVPVFSLPGVAIDLDALFGSLLQGRDE